MPGFVFRLLRLHLIDGRCLAFPPSCTPPTLPVASNAAVGVPSRQRRCALRHRPKVRVARPQRAASHRLRVTACAAVPRRCKARAVPTQQCGSGEPKPQGRGSEAGTPQDCSLARSCVSLQRACAKSMCKEHGPGRVYCRRGCDHRSCAGSSHLYNCALCGSISCR